MTRTATPSTRRRSRAPTTTPESWGSITAVSPCRSGCGTRMTRPIFSALGCMGIRPRQFWKPIPESRCEFVFWTAHMRSNMPGTSPVCPGGGRLPTRCLPWCRPKLWGFPNPSACTLMSLTRPEIICTISAESTTCGWACGASSGPMHSPRETCRRCAVRSPGFRVWRRLPVR